MSNSVLLFGGSFDPFHFGHLHLLSQCVTRFSFTDVVLMPTYLNPLKESSRLPAQDRLALLTAIKHDLPFADRIRYHIDPFEVNQARACYTVDSLQYVKQAYNASHCSLLLGSDTFFSLQQWKNYAWILKNVSLYVVRRDDKALDAYHDYIRRYLHLKSFRSIIIIDSKINTISSSTLWEKFKHNDDISDTVPDCVLSYLTNNSEELLS